MRFSFYPLVALLLCAFPSFAESEKTFEITPLIGYRFGGDFETGAADFRNKLELEDAVNYGLIFSWPFDYQRQGEVLLSHYDTQFLDNTGVSPTTAPLNTDISITYLHVGGNVPVREGANKIPVWLSGGLGLTHFSPDNNQLKDETRFSLNLGLFTKYQLSENLSFRLGTRLYATFFDSASEVLCEKDSCAIYVEGDLWFQSEVNAGVTFTF